MLVSPSNDRGYLVKPLLLDKVKINEVVNPLTNKHSNNHLFIGKVVHLAYEIYRTENALINKSLIDAQLSVNNYDRYNKDKNSKKLNDIKPKQDDIKDVMTLAKQYLTYVIDTVGHLPQLNEIGFFAQIKPSIYLGGTADIVLLNDDNTVSIVDIKNYSSLSKYQIVEHYKQCLAYSLLANDRGYVVKDIQLLYPAQQQLITLSNQSLKTR